MTLKKEREKKKRSQRLRLVEHFVPVQLDLGVEFARRWLLRELVAGGASWFLPSVGRRFDRQVAEKSSD